MSEKCPSRVEHDDQSETQGQEACAQQVPQSCEVGDGEVVWVHTPSPQPLHHQTGHKQQNQHLQKSNNTIVRVVATH